MDRRFELSRRELARVLLALPAVPALARAEEKQPPSPLAEFLASREPGLSPAERAALRKSVVGLEKTLQVIRDFKLVPDAAPCLRFAALKSKGR